MPSDADAEWDAIRRLVRRGITPEKLSEHKETLAAHDKKRRDALDPIAERLLGVRPEHEATLYTQHPLMVGVLRQALQDAYDAGGQALLIEMLAGPKGTR